MNPPKTLPDNTIIDGKYRVVRVLGRGGMGVVYLAENVRVKRFVAIKVLSAGSIQGSEEAVVRFEREAQAAGRIGSEHIVEVLDLGTTDDGDRFMVMELLEGETLKQRIRTGRVPPDKLVHIFCELLDGLEAAHAAGIIHRDLKPDNVFLQRERAGRKDWVKILDFGISKFSALGGDSGQQTRTGMVMGTPYYMSPEQARAAHTVDTRSDLYTVGVMLYEMLTGQVPYPGTTFAELMFKIVFEPQPHPRTLNPALDDEMAAIVVKGMHREPASRYQSAAEFRAALKGWQDKLAAGLLPVPGPMTSSALTGLPLPPAATMDDAKTLLFESSPNLASTAPAPTSAPLASTAPPISASLTQQSWNQAASTAAPERKKGKGALVAVALAVLVLGGGAAYFATKGGAGSVPAAPANAGQVPTPTPTREAPPPPAPPPAAAPIEATANAPIATAEPTPSASTAAKRPGVVAAPTGQASPSTTTKPTKGKAVVTDYGY